MVCHRLLRVSDPSLIDGKVRVRNIVFLTRRGHIWAPGHGCTDRCIVCQTLRVLPLPLKLSDEYGPPCLCSHCSSAADGCRNIVVCAVCPPIMRKRDVW